MSAYLCGIILTCSLMTLKAIKKFSSSINGKLRNFFQAKGDKSYYFVLENEIQEIKLKKIKKKG